MLVVNLLAFVAFAVGLIISDHTVASGGTWIPSAIVGAVLLGNVSICGWAVSLRKNAPVYEEAFVSLILDSVDALITVYESSGKLLRANKAAEKLSGYSQVELLDPEVWRAILPGDEFERINTITSGRRADDYPIINEN